MPKNEDGEFELILGNRQLLSVFFIVVILLGVFFTMGYIVGRNSPTATATADVSTPTKADSAPTGADLPTKAPDAAPTPAPASPPTSPPTETAPQQPASSTPKDTERLPPPAELEKSAPTRESTRSAAGAHPAAGASYLQLAATSQHEADILVDVLRKKRFRAMAAEIDEKPGTFRVLVGPVTDTSSNKMRADLQSAGFPGNAAIRRTF